jgi:hypothetical protein
MKRNGHYDYGMTYVSDLSQQIVIKHLTSNYLSVLVKGEDIYRAFYKSSTRSTKYFILEIIRLPEK